MLTYQALLEYIRKAKDFGASDEEISRRLKAAGWYQVDVQDALDLYRKLTVQAPAVRSVSAPAAPAPTLFERLIPRHYDPHLVAIAVFSFALGFLGYLWLTQ